MELAINILISINAIIHIYILWFEMFAWLSRGPKIFRSFEKELFPKTQVMAANQGLYNGFLAVGLIWSLCIADVEWSKNVALFFLGCIAVAGLYGAYSASRKIIFVQTIPAGITILLILLQGWLA